MSTPENPLSQYYTYAYHHILMACDTTEVAEAIQKSNEFVTFLRTPQQVNTPDNRLGKYKAVSFQNKGKYSIIVNGMTDAEFVISDAKWLSITAASAGSTGVDRFSTMAIEGSFTIQEPRGIKFMNVLSYVADQLQSDPSGLIFVLKTIFVGYPAPGSAFIDPTRPESGDAYDPITNIRPVLFIMYDITGEFKVTGGTYEIKWCGVNNSASKQRHTMRAADRIKLNLADPKPRTSDSTSSTGDRGSDARTLAGALKKLENEIGIVYDRYYTSIISKIREDQSQFNGRKVEYIIQAEKPYVIIDANGVSRPNADYVVTDFKQQNTDTGFKNAPGILDLSSAQSVESAILMIASRCPKVKEDMVYTESETTGERVRWIPKVVSTVVSTKDKYQIIFKLRRVMEGRSDIIEKILKRSSDNINDRNIQQNTLEFDYFFTGKNTDIVNFDLKMELGLVFFQTLVTTETLKDSEEELKLPVQQEAPASDGFPKTEATKEARNRPSQPKKIRPNTPIFISTKFDDKLLKNSVNPRLSSDFQYLLNRHAALENLEAKVTIHGNPGLLNASNKQPSEVLRHTDFNQTDADIRRDPFPYWETTPALVKLNIRMPSDGEDQDFTEPFWYEGYYYCFGITHMFSDGEFTQELDMISLPQSTTKGSQTQQSKNASGQESQTDKQKTSNNQGSSSASTGGTKDEDVQKNQVPASNPSNIGAGNYLDSFFNTQDISNC
jgi:hypothetical protein